MDSNQLFRTKILNIKPNKDILKIIKSWKNKIYSRGISHFELLSIKELTREEVLCKFNLSGFDLNKIKCYELKTSKIGAYQIHMQIAIYEDGSLLNITY